MHRKAFISKAMSKAERRASGFTLMEIMLVVGLIAIVASVAYPAYSGYLVKARRAQAQADLMQLAAALERHKLATYSYKKAAGTQGSPADTGSPWVGPSYSPADGQESDKAYSLTISSVGSGRSFTLQATPVGAQVGDGKLLYYHSGLKEWDSNNDGTIATSEKCWSGPSCN